MAEQSLTPFGSALSGALGSIFANAAVYPLDTVKTRLQALPADERSSPTSPSSIEEVKAEVKRVVKEHDVKSVPRGLIRRLRKWEMLNMLLRIIKTEGLAGVFKGFSANMINTFSQQFAYFFFHTSLRSALMARLGLLNLSTAQELALGALAGAFAQIFTIPVSVIALRQQISSSKTPKSLLQVGHEIVEENGWTGLWTGLKPGLVLTVNPAITYGVFERVKGIVLARRGVSGLVQGQVVGQGMGQRLTVGESFWIGVASKTLATVVTYPYIFAKVRLQAKSTKSISPVNPPQALDGNIKPSEPSTLNDTNPAAQTSSTDTENEAGAETYAEIASHTPSPDAPVISSGEATDLEKAIPNHSSSSSSASSIQNSISLKRSAGGKSGEGALNLLGRVYKQKGIGGWYQGLGAQIIKAVLCQGILFVSKDQFESYTILILALLSKLRKRFNLTL